MSRTSFLSRLSLLIIKEFVRYCSEESPKCSLKNQRISSGLTPKYSTLIVNAKFDASYRNANLIEESFNPYNYLTKICTLPQSRTELQSCFLLVQATAPPANIET